MRWRTLVVAAGLGIGVGAAAVLLGAAPAGAATTATLNGAGRLTVNGTSAGETIVVRAVNATTIGVGPRTFPASAVHSIQVNGLGGNDTIRIDDAQRAFTQTRPTVIDGGGGNDNIRGGKGGETLRGSNGNDTVTGLRGNDIVQLGAGTDTAVWNTGQGNDQVQGGTGADTQRTVGTPGADAVSLAPQSGQVRIGLGSALVRAATVETIDVRLGDGADTVDGAALTGLGVITVNLVIGPAGGADAAADAVNLAGTTAPDVAQAAVDTGTVAVTGLGAEVRIAGSGAAQDRISLAGDAGNDTLSGAVGLAALMQLTLDGGDNNDTLNGGNGADTLIGGANNDTIDGNGGNDTAFLGAGTDTFVWDPGDGSDVVEGQDGVDTLLFNGAAGAEIFAASSNGGRLLFTRNVGNIVMDVDDVEVLTVNSLGGIDTITVNDLAGTDVVDVNLNLGVNGVGDGTIDAVTVNGTVADDVFQVTSAFQVRQPDYDVSVSNSELANDTVTINSSGGNDGIFSSASVPNARFTFNGGTGNDTIVGTSGNDTINGEDGDDIMFGGAGDDTFTGGANTDTAFGQAGADVNGGGIETFTQ